MDKIIVRGAREHNLRNIDVEIPRDTLTVITGLSGSGKSSLAFDTIYAEGQRRYVESLSAYARQFLELMQKPDVDSIEGLSPAISIDQKTTSRNPRSTVGTVTEIYDYMRLLWARIGVPHSPATGLPIESQTVSQMVDRITAMPEGRRLLLLAPVVRGRKGEYKKDLADLQRRGFQRVKVDGVLREIDAVPALNKKVKHDIEVVVDRIVVREGVAQRLADSLETALALADGLVFAEDADTGERTTFSAKFACPVSGFTLDEIEPRLFSFNNPAGACPACDGLGTEMYFDPELVIPDERLSLAAGAIAPWANSTSHYYRQTLDSLSAHFGFSLTVPFAELADDVRRIVLYGSGREPVTLRYEDGVRGYEVRKPFEGVIPNLERRWRETESAWVREELGRYQTVSRCETCGGRRLKPEALSVKIAGHDIVEICDRSISEAAAWFARLDGHLGPQHKEIARRILREINERLGFLNNVGLAYLSLSRTSGTLSGGESQRIRLASQIGSGLTGVLYVLDEPSIGLHPRDNGRLLAALQRLKALGNTVIVVEHDEEAIESADYLIDMGPGAGTHGGRIVARGTPADVKVNPDSLTGQYLMGLRQIATRAGRRRKGAGAALRIVGAAENNLKDISVDVPLGCFTCVTGVSGSGKSTLVLETLYRALARRLHGAREHPGRHERIEGIEFIDKVVDIDQSPIGRTPRSNPATYTGAFTPIRDWFAALPESATRGYRPGRFSFNVKGGRCEACQGDGVIKIEMHFLPDVYVECEILQGKALQPGDAGDPLPRQVDRRCPRHDGRRGRPVLQGGAGDPRQDGNPGARRSRLHPLGPTGDDVVGRRGAAGEAGEGAVPAGDRPHRLHPRRTDHGAALRRREQAPRRAARARRPGQHGDRHRAQPRCHQDRRLDHRSRPGGRRRRRRDHRLRHPGRNRRHPRQPHRPLPRPLPRPRAHAKTGVRRGPPLMLLERWLQHIYPSWPCLSRPSTAPRPDARKDHPTLDWRPE